MPGFCSQGGIVDVHRREARHDRTSGTHPQAKILHDFGYPAALGLATGDATTDRRSSLTRCVYFIVVRRSA